MIMSPSPNIGGRVPLSHRDRRPCNNLYNRPQGLLKDQREVLALILLLDIKSLSWSLALAFVFVLIFDEKFLKSLLQ